MVWIILAGALVLRLIYLFQTAGSPFFDFPQIDALWHHLWASEIAGGNLLGSEVFFRAPLYPYFLGLIYSIFGDGPTAIRIVQSVLGSISCVLIYLIALRVFNRPIAIIAGIISALYAVLIYFDNELLITNLFVLLTLLLLLLILNTKLTASWKRYYLLGIMAGLAAVARPTILVTLPILIFYLCFYGNPKIKTTAVKIKFSAVLIAGVLTVVLPVTIRNYAVGHDLVLISYQGGVNFWIGNNEQADGKTAGAPGNFKAYDEYQDNVKFSSERVAELELGHKLKPSELSSYWYGRGFSFIVNHPGQFLKLTLTKLYFSWNGYEIESNRDLYTQRPYSPLFSVLLWDYGLAFPFGIVGPLALLGIFLLFRSWKREYLLLLGFLASYQIVLIIFFVTARFRTPMLPVIIIFSAFALYQLYANRHKIKFIAQSGLTVLILIILANTSFLGIKPASGARNNQALASIFMRQNRLDSALVYARQAVEDDRQSAEAWAFLGAALEMKQDFAKAADAFQSSVNLNPNDALTQNHLGYNYLKSGQMEQALTACSRALQIDSTIIDIYTNLGNIYAALNQPDRAFEIMQRGYKNAEPDIAFLNNYAIALQKQNNYSLAIEVLLQVVQKDPGYLLARVNLGNLYFQARNPAEAEYHYLEALKLDNTNIQANLNLAQLYMRTDQTDKAVPLIEKVLGIHPDNKTALQLRQMILQNSRN